MELNRLFKFREQAEQNKPFLDHLEDLRWMLVKMAITLMMGMLLSFAFCKDLVRLLQKPLRDIDPALVTSLQVLNPMDSITISIKLAFYAGLVVTFPILLLFLAQFVLPALTLKEKKFLVPGILIAFGLFCGGVCVSYFIVLPITLKFCYSYTRSLEWSLHATVTSYFAFVTNITLALGLVCEMPIVVMALNYLGFLSVAMMRKTRIYAIPLLFVLAAIIAPTPDPFTLIAFGVPLYLLYESCIWLAWLVERRKGRPA